MKYRTPNIPKTRPIMSITLIGFEESLFSSRERSPRADAMINNIPSTNSLRILRIIVLILYNMKIPSALRQQVWLEFCGSEHFKQKCFVKWCKNIITPFTFEVGHNIPESKGGSTDISNLRPICSSCNKSMSNNYTIDEFSMLYSRVTEPKKCFPDFEVFRFKTH